MIRLIDAYCITVFGNSISEKAFRVLEGSSIALKNPFFINKYHAVIPEEIDEAMKYNNIHWDYPLYGICPPEKCKKFCIVKTPYKTSNNKAKIACAISHYELWKKCYIEDRPILILEHDAIFIKQLNESFIEKILDSPYTFIGLNDPRGATRKSDVFYNAIQKEKSSMTSSVVVAPCPFVDKDHSILQGLAGGSAYIIKPDGAAQLLDLIDDCGLWHNDAIISNQTLPNRLGITTSFFTKIQKGIPSTTVISSPCCS